MYAYPYRALGFGQYMANGVVLSSRGGAVSQHTTAMVSTAVAAHVNSAAQRNAKFVDTDTNYGSDDTEEVCIPCSQLQVGSKRERECASEEMSTLNRQLTHASLKLHEEIMNADGVHHGQAERHAERMTALHNEWVRMCEYNGVPPPPRRLPNALEDRRMGYVSE